jgi:hypothetical protein
MRERTTWIAGCEILGSQREDLLIVGNLPLRLATAKTRSLNWSTNISALTAMCLISAAGMANSHSPLLLGVAPSLALSASPAI